MELYIAEKPSVGRTIASVIGANERRDGYWEGNGRLVSWCIGHLVALAIPEAYRSDYQRWRYSDLPILPDKCSTPSLRRRKSSLSFSAA